jgi:hypothetical protein
MDQVHAEIGFEPRQAPAEAGFGNAGPAAGRREAAGIDDFDEQDKVAGTIHRASSRKWN